MSRLATKSDFPLSFSPVVEGRRALNGLDEQKMDLSLTNLNHILDAALTMHPLEEWVEQAVLARTHGLIELGPESERAKYYVEICLQIWNRGIPLNAEYALSQYNDLVEGYQRESVSDSEAAEKYLKQSIILKGLNVDEMDRHHYWANPFAATSGRDRPKGKCYCYLKKKFRKDILSPPDGKTIAMIDYGQQDPGVLAALSNDQELISCYQSTDLYEAVFEDINLPFVQGLDRKQKKIVVVALINGMAASSLSKELDCSYCEAEKLLQQLKHRFSVAFNWLNRQVFNAYQNKVIHSLDWQMWVHPRTPEPRLMNWPIQAAGADILRRACISLEKEQIPVIATIHDAIMIEVDSSDASALIERTQQIMASASCQVIERISLRSDIEFCISG